MATFTDNFNRADGAIGNGWLQMTGGLFNTPFLSGIVGNIFEFRGGGDPHGYERPENFVQGTTSFTYREYFLPAIAALTARRQTNGDYYLAYATAVSGAAKIYRVTGNTTYTDLVSDVTGYALTDGDILEFDVSGSTLNFSYTRGGTKTVICTATNNVIATAGRFGIYSESSGIKVEDFNLTSSDAGGGGSKSRRLFIGESTTEGVDGNNSPTTPASSLNAPAHRYRNLIGANLANSFKYAFNGHVVPEGQYLPTPGDYDPAKLIDVENYGKGGQKVEQATAAYATQVNTKTADYTLDRIFLNIGANNSSTDTGAQIYQKWKDYNANKLANANQEIWICTVAAVNTPAYNTVLLEANRLLRADRSMFNGFVDFARDTRFTDPSDTTYFFPDSHWTNALNQIAAETIRAAELGTLTYPVFTTAAILGPATAGTATERVLAATGNPTVWQFKSGTLPTGMTFNGALNKFVLTSAVPAGTYSNLVVWAIDANNRFDERSFSIVVNAPGGSNQSPTCNAGVDQTITLPATASLTGTASDDGFGGSTLTTLWSKVSGAGTVTFGNANSLSTTATFSIAGVYVLRLTASDGTLSTTDDVTITVNAAGGDTTPPTVAITAPSSGATISGTAAITATAADNIGVTSVTFIIDNINTVGTDNSAPYNYLLDTTALTDGAHTVKAVALDAAGNSTTSANLPFTVDNSAPPLPNATAQLAWNASTDNVTAQSNIVYLLKFSTVSGAAAQLATPIVLAPGVRVYNVPNIAQGTTVYKQTAARDEAGNVSAYSNIFSQTY